MKNSAIFIAGFAVLISTSQCLEVVNIGALLSSQGLGDVFQQAVEKLNTIDELDSRFNSTFSLMNENPMHAAKLICSEIIPRRVVAVIISSTKVLRQDNTDLSTMAASFTCGFYKIPNIAVSMRMSTFSNKNLHPYFLRTVPPFSEQSEVWVHLLLHYGFKKVIFILSTEIEGRSLLSKFQSLAALKDINIEQVVKMTSVQHLDQRENERILNDLPSYRSRVILLSASLQDSDWIFKNAVKYNLTNSGYVWIVCERSLTSKYLPQGVLAVRLLNGDDEKAHIKDAVAMIGEVFKLIQRENVNLTQPPAVCGSQDNSGWDMGHLFKSYFLKSVLHFGNSAHELRFSRTGDQSNASYEIVNYNKNIRVIGYYGKKDGLKIHKNNVMWPGNQHLKPKGVKINTNLRVVTIESVPFVYTMALSSTGACDVRQVECIQPGVGSNKDVTMCCYGYVIEMLMHLSVEVNFTYTLHLVADNQYGTFERRNGSSEKSWDGMMAELLNSQSDVIAAPLTIDPERAKFIGFSKPFKYQGLTILVKKTMKDSSLASFLQPFQNTLWILVGLSVHVVALVLYLLDHFSPFGRFKLAKNNDTEEDALNLSSAMWFSWGVLLNSGIGEGTPRSFSARVLGMVWAGFAMIIVASYTANLAAFLVLDRREASLSGINDARLRNPQQNFKYATVQNSAVLMYFKRQVELSSMYRTMLPINYETAEEAIRDVKTGKKLQAFIWDSSRLEYEASKDCDLSTAGELFGRSGYGIGLTKDSPWMEPVSLAILKFHESGFMEQLDARYILANDGKCPEKDMSPATLGLTNMAGVFMMVAGGIIAGVLLIFIEIAYKRHRGLKDKEMHLAKMAVDRWRSNIEKRSVIRDSFIFLSEEMKKRRILRETVLLQLQHDDLHPDLHNRQPQGQWSSVPCEDK